MYCQKCGYKLESNSFTCPNCGSRNDEIEYCGGFWGLVHQDESKKLLENKREEARKEEVRSETARRKRNSAVYEERQRKKKKQGVVSVLLCACVLFVIISMIQTVQVASGSEKYREMETRMEEHQGLESENQRLLEENENLESENQRLADENEDLQKQIKEDIEGKDGLNNWMSRWKFGSWTND